MNVLRYLVAGLLVTALSGCRPSQPVAAPAPTAPPPVQPADAVPSTTSPESSSSDTPSVESPTTEPATPTQPIDSPAPPPADQSNLAMLAARLIDSDGQGGWRINEKAATELERLGPQAGDELLPLLAHDDTAVRRGAAYYLLGQFDPNNADHVRGFSALVEDSDRTIRGIGLSAIREMRTDDQVAAAKSVAGMLDPSREDKPDNRASVARLLGSLRLGGAEALGDLERTSANDPDARVRSAALIAITQIADPQTSLEPLIKALGDNDPAVRLVAASRLRLLGSKAGSAVDALVAALGDTDMRVREAAAQALIAIGQPAVSPLASTLNGSNVESRKLALACLAKIGPGATAAVPEIEKCLMDPDPQVRKLAETALRRIKP